MHPYNYLSEGISAKQLSMHELENCPLQKDIEIV